MYSYNEASQSVLVSNSSSISTDKRLYKQVIIANMLHARFLLNKNIINNDDYEKIHLGLKEILKRLENGVIKIDPSSKNIQYFINNTLNYYIDDISKKLDIEKNYEVQYNLALKLYIDKQIDIMISSLCSIKELLYLNADKTKDDFINNFIPHFNDSLLNHLLGYHKVFDNDINRLKDYKKRSNSICLINNNEINIIQGEEVTFQKIDFQSICLEQLSFLLDMDYIIELSSILSIIMMHISKLIEEFLLFSSTNNNFIEFSVPNFFCNEKIEVKDFIHIKSLRIYGDIIKLFSSTNLNSNAYMTENLESIFDTIDTSLFCVETLKEILLTVKVTI